MPLPHRLVPIFASATVAALLITAGPAVAASAPRPGRTCTQLGNHVTSQGVELVCVSKGRKRIWQAARSTAGSSSGSSSRPSSDNSLPALAALTSARSDVLPIDITNAYSIAPFLGSRSTMPHRGLHVNFRGTGPFSTTLAPTSYPAVRAVADGVVSNVEPLRAMGTHQAYGLNLVIGQQGRDDITLNYSLEPFVMEPSPGYYARFLSVKNGQRVRKGDVLGYLYVPPGQTQGTHLHFHMNVGQAMSAPTLFTPAAVSQLQARFGEPGGIENGVQLPACIGYKVDASENPLGTGAVDCLN